MELWSAAPRFGRLADAVDHVWVCRRPGAVGDELVLPSGRSQIVFGVDPNAPVAVVHGPATRPTRIDVGAQRLAVGVVFRPGGLRAVAALPASEFVDRSVAVGDVLPVDATGFAEQLLAATSNAERAALFGRLLTERLHRVDRPSSLAVHLAIDELDHGRSVSAAATHVELGGRRLREAFRDEVGVGPKTFARIRRFHRALRSVRSGGADSLATIASDLGYADQSHMTRDFAEFAGTTPGSMHRDASSTPTHICR